MKKIPNLFERDWNGNKSRVLPVFNASEDVSWVVANEGSPTIKWDGSAVLVRAGKLYVRYDCKREKTPPAGFEPCQEKDSVTGHRPGWIPASGNPAAKWHLDAFTNSGGANLSDGTYEALGPQHQTNPYKLHQNVLVRHGLYVAAMPLLEADPVAAFDYLKGFLHGYLFGLKDLGMPAPMLIEGLVFHHPDGRMVKVLASDLGLPWKEKVRS